MSWNQSALICCCQKRAIILDIQNEVQELRLPSAAGLSCRTASGLVTAIVGTGRDTNSSRNKQRFKSHQGGTTKAPGKLLNDR